MITIDNTAFTSGISFPDILAVQTKAELLQICKKLDLYVSPNLKKDETVHRVAVVMMTNPINILSVLNKQELLIVDEFMKGGPNTYVTRKMRKTPYKLQKFSLVMTFEDEQKQEWKMLMPDSVRNALSVSLPAYLDLAQRGVKPPSPKQLRMMAAMQRLMDEGEENEAVFGECRDE